MNKLLKLLVFIADEIFTHFDFLVVKKYGDIQKTMEEENIMASGFYLAARKIVHG